MQEENQHKTESPEPEEIGQVDDVADDSEELEDQETFDEAESRAAELSEEERLQRVQVLKPIVEGAIMAAGEALKLTKIQTLFDEFEMPSKGLLIETLEAIQQDCDGRGFALVEVASGWRFQVREDYAQWVNRLWEEKPQKYSRALLETLALVAYRQPITRGDIEEVRGVAVSSHIMKTLTEREWVKVVGHRDVPGRPALYATTKQFLDYFNMKSLDELPTLGELQDIESLNESLEFADAPEQVPAQEPGLESDSAIEVAVSQNSESQDSEPQDSEPQDSEHDGSETENPELESSAFENSEHQDEAITDADVGSEESENLIEAEMESDAVQASGSELGEAGFDEAGFDEAGFDEAGFDKAKFGEGEFGESELKQNELEQREFEQGDVEEGKID